MFPLDVYTAHARTLDAYKHTAKLFTIMEIPVAHTRQTISSIEYDRIACDQKCLKSNFLCASLLHVCTLQFTLPCPNVPRRESLTIGTCSMVVIAIRWTDCAAASVMHTQTFGLSLCRLCRSIWAQTAHCRSFFCEFLSSFGTDFMLYRHGHTHNMSHCFLR